ncbi:transcriptional regulator [Kineobactrum sediminis]|uniref:Transcriptional regulator n=2 Tax=Kineobactrum sediminis TaxID=1905677 RepID=A0A2N5Y0N1_9GAMM|nr:transcriptional regulator [Kineobactrum sediminis]
MAVHAEAAAALLRQLANRNRLMVLCALVEGEKSVGALNEQVPLSQSALSQHLGRLRAAGLVTTRREGKLVRYSLTDDKATSVLQLLHTLYCAD